jgi:hypothetical protein
MKEGISDKLNSNGTIGKFISKLERDMEDIKGVLDDDVDQGMLHGEHHLIQVQRKH